MAATCTEHKTCQMLAKFNAALAAAVVPLLNYQGGLNEWVMGVGLENGGPCKDKYNLCAGKGEKKDYNKTGFCWLKNALRELFEEFTIQVTWANFDSYFRGSNGKIRVFLHNRTPIFIMVLPSGTSRKPIKAQMMANMQNPALPHCYREMRDFEFIKLSDGQQIERHGIVVSSFADAVRRKIDVTKL
jgi:hypothetical protein